MARPTNDDQRIEEACSMAHADASASIDLIDLNNELIRQIYDREPKLRDWLMRLTENQGVMKQHQRSIQRHMKALLDDEQTKRTNTDRLGKIRKASND